MQKHRDERCKELGMWNATVNVIPVIYTYVSGSLYLEQCSAEFEFQKRAGVAPARGVWDTLTQHFISFHF